ncbi:MAG: Type 1 glutamine amidotransferase-like domain-containing protein [Patescibacteria group bacterium]
MHSTDTVVAPAVFPAPQINPNFRGVLIGGDPAHDYQDPHSSNILLDAGLEMTGQQSPNVLIIPSARWRSETGVNNVSRRYLNYYGKVATAAVLHPFLYQPHNLKRPRLEDLPIDLSRLPLSNEMSEKIEAADLVFVLGADTNRMLNQVWRPHGIVEMLAKAIERGVVMSGTSAGALVWFDGCLSDSSSLQTSRDLTKPESYHYMKGLSYISNSVAAPHYDSHSANQSRISRKESFCKMMYKRRKLGELGLGIDNNAALEIVDGRASVVVGGRDGRRSVYARHYRNGSLEKRVLTPRDASFTFAELVE